MCTDRLIVPFPPGRPTKEHIHTPHDTKYVVPLEQYKIPEDVQMQILADKPYTDFQVWNTKENWCKRLVRTFAPCNSKLIGLLCSTNCFGGRKHTAKRYCLSRIACAELRTQQITRYDLWNVEITRVSAEEARCSEPAVEIRVPGLEEKRPSLLKNDRVYVWQLGASYAYEGIVWDVRKSSIVALFGCTNSSLHEQCVQSLLHSVVL